MSQQGFPRWEKQGTNMKEEERMMPPVSEGQRLGHYRLHRLLGRGSFADVYLGEHLYLQTSVALKILHKTLDEEEEQLFLAEAQTLARLAHPHIIRVREFAIERSLPYLVMDYAPGGTLRRRYPKGTCLSLQQTATTIKQIASALQYAHNQGIIHRDVKPENVLQGADQVLLSDFGISITTPPLRTPTSQSWTGTAPYMAPEQFLGRAVFASDQYALAIMAYEWLCGERPFEGSHITLAYQHVQVPPPHLREKDPSLPEAVQAVIEKALSKDPKQRYAGVLVFARALERACQAKESDTRSTDNGTVLADKPDAPPNGRIFLSHAESFDSTGLKADLSLRNLEVLSEVAPRDQDANASSREEQTRQAIRAAQVVLLVLTPHTRAAARVHDHLRIARLYRRRILCFWQEGETLQELLPAGAEAATILDARGPRYHQAIDELIQGSKREQHGVTNVAPVLPEPTFEPRNPYKGLQAFTWADRADFFGRHFLVQELLGQLKEQLVRPASEGARVARLLAVIGPSGSGKSSVVMAGLLPALADGALPGSTDWIYLEPLVPGPQPLDALMRLFAARFPQHNPQAIRESLDKPGGFGLHHLGVTLVNQPHMRLVVTIDQCEQLFSSDISEPDRQHFLEVLVRAATEPRGPVLVLLTLRADFYDRPFAYPEFGRLIQQHQCTVLPMSLDELREVIERPALLADVRLIFDDDLVGDLLFDLHGQNAALPLLEFTLEQLFYRRRQHRLTRAAYHEIGGVRGALAQHAEATYTALPSEEHRRLARLLFLRLVQPGEGGQDQLRRRAERSEFELVQAEHTQMLHQVIDAFIAARLITSTRSLGRSTLEISHEALLREWPRLARWVRESHEDIRLQRAISLAVADWARRGKPKDRLYRGAQLKEADAWAKRNLPNQQEVTFLKAGFARQHRGRVWLTAAVLLFVLLAGGIAWLVHQLQSVTPPDPTLVTNLQDDGRPQSLRYDIDHAPTGSTIRFAANLSGHEIDLTGDLLITRALTLEGPSDKPITINAVTQRGAQAPLENNVFVESDNLVTLSNLHFLVGIFNGAQSSLLLENSSLDGTKQDHITGLLNGVGIFNKGTLTLDHSTISNFLALSGGSSNGSGGGIENLQGKVILRNKSVVFDNTSETDGGGISNNDGTVILDNSTVCSNLTLGSSQTGNGGGIYNGGGTVILNHSIIQGNLASQIGQGGGIYNGGGGTLTVQNSTISENTTLDGDGGGLINVAGTADIFNSTISTNTATGANSGGVENIGGTLHLDSSTVSRNTARGSNGLQDNGGGASLTLSCPQGYPPLVLRLAAGPGSTTTNTGLVGGIGNFQGTDSNGQVLPATMTLTNSTISGNTASAFGGGIFNFKGDMHILFCTVVGNSASSAAGIVNASGRSGILGPITFATSIIAGNIVSSDPNDANIAGSDITSSGYNLIQGSSFAGLNGTDSFINNLSDVQMAPTLGDNSGPTQTLQLYGGSPAIDKIPLAACQVIDPATNKPVQTDQRGMLRPDDKESTCDIGAYESS